MLDNYWVLLVLKHELSFLESGGYHGGRRPFPALIFQDSPTCPNVARRARMRPCSECALARFVPVQRRFKPAACRYIRLNDAGETLESLYRTATQAEIEAAVSTWLRRTVARLEEDLRRKEDQMHGCELGFGPVP